MRGWIKSSFKRAFKGVGIEAASVLLLTPIFLTVHAYFARPGFFRRTLLPALFDAYPPIASSVHAGALAYYYWFVATSISLLAIPLASAYLAPGLKVREMGFRARKVKFGLGAVLIFYLAILPLLFIVSRTPAFQGKYPLCKSAAKSTEVLLTYELLYGLYMFSWEFFFRGYMLFGLERALGGGYAILIQTIPFTLMHIGKPFLETLGAVFAGVILGILAIETRTFFFGALLHWMVALSLDLMVIKLS